MSKEEEYPEDVIDGRGEDDGFFSSVIQKAQAYSEDIASVFPKFHPQIPQDEIDRIKSLSYIAYRRGYFDGHADAKQQEDAENS